MSYLRADTPPPSREVLLSENKRALEIIEYNSNYYPPEIKAEIDELVRQEESDIDGLVHAIAGKILSLSLSLSTSLPPSPPNKHSPYFVISNLQDLSAWLRSTRRAVRQC